jgi:hypothetical protein
VTLEPILEVEVTLRYESWVVLSISSCCCCITLELLHLYLLSCCISTVLRTLEVEVTLRLIVSQSLCLGIEHPCGTCDQILFPVGMLLSEICGLVSIGRPLWREDGSVICSVITQQSESLRTRNHTLLSHLRLSQPGGPGFRIYIPQEQSGPVIPPGTGLLRTVFVLVYVIPGRII